MAPVALRNKAEGSLIKLKENGIPVDFYVIKHDYESGLNGSGRVLVVRKDCYDQRQWHNSNVNAYATSAIDTWLNGTYKNLLDANIRTAMGTTKIYYTPGSANTTKTTLGRAVFLLSATELGHTHTDMNTEGTMLSSTALNLLKTSHLNGYDVVQWTRSPCTDGAHDVWYVYSGGSLGRNGCSRTVGSRPAFTLPAALLISDDGSITTNTAPSAPGSISYPTSIQGGSSITVSWGASSDAEGNLAGYKVEKSTNGGSSWSQIYQGGARQTNDAVAFGTPSVLYRVRAYDTEGLHSGWKTGSSVTVINNSAPGAPPSITVPAAVRGGSTLPISWGRATDSDNNLSGYELERSIGGGAWSRIYKGSALSYTDTITKGWASVAYRVRAYDTQGAASAYTTSSTRTVDNNTAPAITGSTPSGSDLGTQNEGFAFTYTVSDVDSDTVTVKEYLDDSLLRSYTATLGQENTFPAVTVENYQKVLNGPHTLKVVANDGKEDSAPYTVSFAKLITAASITLAEPLEADDLISIMVLSIAGSLPADANLQVLVTNNAKDDEPVWEDATADIRQGANHLFTNQSAANGFAFNFRLAVSRGSSGLGGYISSIGGAFE